MWVWGECPVLCESSSKISNARSTYRDNDFYWMSVSRMLALKIYVRIVRMVSSCSLGLCKSMKVQEMVESDSLCVVGCGELAVQLTMKLMLHSLYFLKLYGVYSTFSLIIVEMKLAI
jgi:hypothetical protein